MIPTLHNLAHIALQAKNREKALSCWSEALSLAMETGNAEGIFEVSRALGHLSAQVGNKDQARELLNLAVDTGNKAGFPGVGEIEENLRALEG